MAYRCQRSFLTVLWLASSNWLGAADWDSEGNERISYNYGDSCSYLQMLSRRELAAITHAVHVQEFSRFCVAQGVYRCQDFNAALHGIGVLEENEISICSFVPHSR